MDYCISERATTYMMMTMMMMIVSCLFRESMEPEVALALMLKRGSCHRSPERWWSWRPCLQPWVAEIGRQSHPAPLCMGMQKSKQCRKRKEKKHGKHIC